MKTLVTGSSGLIGSEAVAFFEELGHDVFGADNNMRATFFGPKGDTSWNLRRLQQRFPRFRHIDLDIRDREGVEKLIREENFDLVVHAAAQPSHDLAAKMPYEDFDVNAVGTLNLLESCRRHAEEAVFLLMSTNKVYGDGPNRIDLVERETRWDYADPAYAEGIAEDFPVDNCMHSLFGASKLAADVMAQEYGRYFGMKVGVFRGGCLTGPSHSGVELHGFLNYLVRVALAEGPYIIYGYKGKQVRDQIHSRDVIRALWAFAQDPHPGEVYNLGGGRGNAGSLMECVEMIRERTGKSPQLTYDEQARIGDHICYYSDLGKMRRHFPDWNLTYSLEEIVDELIPSVEATLRAS